MTLRGTLRLAFMALLLAGCAGASLEREELPADAVIDRWLKNLDPLPETASQDADAAAAASDRDAPRVQIHARGAHLDVLVRALAESLGYGVALKGTARQSITADLENASLDEALSVLRLLQPEAGIELIQGDVIAVSEGALQQDALLRAERMPLRHRSAGSVLETLRSAHADVQFSALQRDGALWVRGSQEALGRVREHLGRLDIPRRQIFIEVFIVELNRSAMRQRGVRLGGEDGTDDRVRGDLKGAEAAGNLLLNMPLQPAAAGVFLANRTGSLRLQLQWLQNRGWSKILSNPRIFVLDGERAEIFEGKEVPYTTTSGNVGTNTEFREAGLKLEVAPRVLVGGRIALELSINQDSVGDGPNPTITKRSAAHPRRGRLGRHAGAGRDQLARPGGLRQRPARRRAHPADPKAPGGRLGFAALQRAAGVRPAGSAVNSPIQWVNALIERGPRELHASDIHLLPSPPEVQMRIDGVLQTIDLEGGFLSANYAQVVGRASSCWPASTSPRTGCPRTARCSRGASTSASPACRWSRASAW